MKLISYLLVFHSFLPKHLFTIFAWDSYSLIFLLLSSRSQLTGMGVLHSLVCTGFYPQSTLVKTRLCYELQVSMRPRWG